MHHYNHSAYKTKEKQLYMQHFKTYQPSILAIFPKTFSFAPKNTDFPSLDLTFCQFIKWTNTVINSNMGFCSYCPEIGEYRKMDNGIAGRKKNGKQSRNQQTKTGNRKINSNCLFSFVYKNRLSAGNIHRCFFTAFQMF